MFPPHTRTDLYVIAYSEKKTENKKCYEIWIILRKIVNGLVNTLLPNNLSM